MKPVSISGVRGTLVILASTALVAAVLLGCESAPPEPQGPVSADAYVAVMAELADLKRFPPPGPDFVTRTARADSVRQAILDRHGVTAEDLLTYAEQLGSHPDRMLELTDRIIAISDSLAVTHDRTPTLDPAKPDSARSDSATTTPESAAVAKPVPVDTALSREKLETFRKRLGLKPETP
jgi:hypothetical protein